MELRLQVKDTKKQKILKNINESSTTSVFVFINKSIQMLYFFSNKTINKYIIIYTMPQKLPPIKILTFL